MVQVLLHAHAGAVRQHAHADYQLHLLRTGVRWNVSWWQRNILSPSSRTFAVGKTNASIDFDACPRESALLMQVSANDKPAGAQPAGSNGAAAAEDDDAAGGGAEEGAPAEAAAQGS